MPSNQSPPPATTPPSTEHPTPNVPIRSSEIAYRSWARGVRFGSDVLPLSELGGAKLVGVKLEILPPGKQSCPFHWHQVEEEHFLILDGRCVLRSGEDRHEMGPGDYVCFPAGTAVAHCFENPFDAPCRFMAIGTREPNEVSVYPDSGKVMVRALRKLVPLPEQGADYWDGERADEPLPKLL